MLRILVLITAVTFITLSARADALAGSRLQADLGELGTRLALSPGQEARVRSIFEEHLEVQTATFDKYDVDTSDRGDAETVDLRRIRALRAELRMNHGKIERRLSEVLSVTQMAEFRRIRAEQEEKLRDRILSKRVDDIGARLELTPEQRERTRPVLEQHLEAQMTALDRHGVAFSKRDGDQRIGFKTLRRLRKDLDEIGERTLERLSAQLSATQFAAYEVLQAEQRRELRTLLFER